MLVDLYLWSAGNFPDDAINVDGNKAQIQVDGGQGLLELVRNLGGAILYPPNAAQPNWLVCIGYKSTPASRPHFGQR